MPRSASLLSNSTAVSDAWVGLGEKFDKMFAKRAFVHWFVGEGMEEGEFLDSRDSLAVLTRDYQELMGNDNADQSEDYF